MDTKALEKFCPWARMELIDAVHLRCVRYALDDTGRTAHPADTDVVNGAVLAPAEKIQRQALYERIERLNEERDGKGYAAFCEQQAYSWFNRFAAIRFMECHGFLSNGVRIFSNAEGAFEPDCLHMASELNLPGLDIDEVLDLMAAGDDGELFRRIIVAQCNELAECLPTVFDHVDDAYALTLPDNLLGKGEHDVLFHLVTDIDESVWNPTGEELNVEVLGWMYQFYNSELKDAFFKSKRKAAVEDLAPATQLFTPDWIVRYMVENSLGRLWMLNNPDSRLRERMEYYIEPDEGHEDFIRVNGPEDITFCDPACGSGHILVYAFSLLFDMYLERGYRERDIPELILTRNLSGLEIDERAAQIASLALALCARAHDRRFFTRGVTADIRVLGNIEIDVDALDPTSALRERPKLIETLAHLSEIGSLLCPSPEDMGALEAELARNLSGDLFVSHTQESITRAAETCEALARTFDVVVANPPYMGSKSFNPFMSNWTKIKYPRSCKDTYSCFIERCRSFCPTDGLIGLVTMQGWLFLPSFKGLREIVLRHNAIESLVHCGTRCFAFTSPGTHDLVSAAAFILRNGPSKSSFPAIDLNHIRTAAGKGSELLRLIHGKGKHTYVVSQNSFIKLPDFSFAYWATKKAVNAFNSLRSLSDYSSLQSGFTSGDNNRFFRFWWEVELSNTSLQPDNALSNMSKFTTWFPITNGGNFRRWYGNQMTLVNWKNDGSEIKNSGLKGSAIGDTSLYFKTGITWGRISAVDISFRFTEAGSIPEHASGMIYLTDDKSYSYLEMLGLLNSSAAQYFFRILSPTVNLTQGPVGALPITGIPKTVDTISKSQIELSQIDWDTQETSWDFKRNPLI